MRDLRRGARVVDEALVAAAFGQRLALQLQRDRPADLGVAGAVDVAEDAFADALEQVVVRDGTGHRSGSRTAICGFDGRSSMRLGRAARRHQQQVDDHLADVFRLNLPVGPIRRAAAAEPGRNRTRHDVGHPDVVVAHFLHQRLENALRPARCAVRRRRAWILAGEAADVDDPAAAALPQVRDRA